MTAYLPGPLLELFKPRELPEWQRKDAEGGGTNDTQEPKVVQAVEYAPSHDKKYVRPMKGIGEYTVFFETAAEMTPGACVPTLTPKI